MIRGWHLILTLPLVAATAAGCDPAGVKEVKVEGKKFSGLDQAKAILQNYANGAPVSSEADSLPDLIEEGKEDP